MNLSRRGFLRGVAAAAVVSRLPAVDAAAISPEPVLLKESGEGTHIFSAYVRAAGETQWTRVVRHFTPKPDEMIGITWNKVRQEWMPQTFTFKDLPDRMPNGSGTFEMAMAQIEQARPSNYIMTTAARVTREEARTNLLIGA